MEGNLGQKLARFVAVMGLLFVIVSAALVSERLSQDALALVIGLACGVSAMVPTVLLAVLLWRRAERNVSASPPSVNAAPANYTPPIIVVAPPALPGASAEAYRGAAAPAWMPEYAAERKFTIVGEP